ncbi:MAG: ATPase [Chloroflexi bacterium]|nr:ATPase [Chloroflexota bacterium]
MDALAWDPLGLPGPLRHSASFCRHRLLQALRFLLPLVGISCYRRCGFATAVSASVATGIAVFATAGVCESSSLAGFCDYRKGRNRLSIRRWVDRTDYRRRTISSGRDIRPTVRAQAAPGGPSSPSQEALFAAPDTVQTGGVQANAGAPLATRMRPTTLDEFVGQEHLVGCGRALRRAIEEDQLSSMILWGPPGSGKTTLAEVISRTTHAHMVALSGVSAGVADLRRAADGALARRSQGQRTILFIDEIHRFNKAQQDTVLPNVESGLLTLIGATTENPSFEVNSALLSRSRVYRLESLSDEDIEALVQRALRDESRGLAMFHVKLDPDALDYIVGVAGGDARIGLNALELATLATSPTGDGERHVIRATVEDAMQRRALMYDRAGDQHYDLVSALIKSIRGSDPDAAVYWLARMLEAGEDPLFVARRLVILASEDVGLADPMALPVAIAAQQAAHFVGMPEALFPLTEAALYLATAPKSNSVKTAYEGAVAEVQRSGALPVPLHLRNAVTGLMRGMGYGKGYKYAHDFEGHVVDQQHLPDAIAGSRFYEPTGEGHEGQIVERVRRVRGPGGSPSREDHEGA